MGTQGEWEGDRFTGTEQGLRENGRGTGLQELSGDSGRMGGGQVYRN